MKKFRNSIFYVGIIGGFSLLMYWIIQMGVKLETGRNLTIQTSDKNQLAEFLDSLIKNLHHPLALLLAQIVTIIFVARIFGWICIKMKQPAVIGEMIAGIVMGPSLIGMYFPEFSAMLFPAESLGNLQFLSQIGLILFMYIVGMEIDMKILRNKAHDAVVISHASIIIPFVLGMGLAYFIYDEFAPANVQFTSFGLFAGIAMSITAFPVLARIVQERGIHKTRLGTIVITCAAADDITAWCILAVVIAIVKAGSFGSAIYTVLLAIGYVILMVKVVRPFLKRIGDLYSSNEKLSKPIVAIFFLTLVISSYLTEVIGIHALFGAFIAGAIMPENVRFRNLFIEKVEDVALVLLLPLFFVFTGLRTQIGLLNEPYLWKIAGVIFLVAVIGKFVSSTLAAKFVGQNWKDSLSIGALMNTRGLTELVALNIGYDLGVLTPELFSMMVIMALATTFMTGPALDLINWLFKGQKEESENDIVLKNKYRILLSFDKPDSGKALLKVADGLTSKRTESSEITAMHFLPTEEIHHYNTETYETESFKEVIGESIELNRNITTMFKASSDIDNEIVTVANKSRHDLLLVGIGRSIYEGSLLGKVLGFTTRIINPEKLINTVTGKENILESALFDDGTKQIIAKSQIPVGILIDKDLKDLSTIFIPLFESKDWELIQPYVQKFIHNSSSKIVVLDTEGKIISDLDTKEKIRLMEMAAPNQLSLKNERPVEKDFLNEQNLMLITIEGWKRLVDTKTSWLSDIPSTLIISEEKK
ncbi:Kef-type K+ transport system membrane component KefB [Flavobacterium sp. HSC-32F16]|uniref:cation:proton antiporter n=1 Tax=Flavobacterium sp. HSC-32F16 TaxID=2910964 RepID=UPI0020A41F34|nr:cation:proton antiporter [Flavobacterium sp. HSC-32F16]MCP2029672.1 Kef-type K+ transport system membrane component KefB [Flavobacterium sp. HSC-32F16]